MRVFLSEDGADAERLGTLTGQLRSELRQLDIDDVRALPAGPPPPGSRAFATETVGAILVLIGQNPDVLRSVVEAVRGWLGRSDGTKRTVRLELGDDVLELSEATADDQRRLIDLFVSRHGT
ncbi:hypothetical protein C8E87_4788 [Paractinoplanes brasiliensis]|uniref:Uncharacterized protein n=2 Tax=Paractinoplanes brasiliensis TaxID=52695 RepID=A0A4R6JZ73_9ACTN|nr:hypothetical protein C8E87_4788 [Actinoplanes brasiliensis]GID26131.1 hypothetical protein Abr02nite_11140 [Actinoplanes brasiliensis]